MAPETGEDPKSSFGSVLNDLIDAAERMRRETPAAALFDRIENACALLTALRPEILQNAAAEREKAAAIAELTEVLANAPMPLKEGLGADWIAKLPQVWATAYPKAAPRSLTALKQAISAAVSATSKLLTQWADQRQRLEEAHSKVLEDRRSLADFEDACARTRDIEAQMRQQASPPKARKPSQQVAPNGETPENDATLLNPTQPPEPDPPSNDAVEDVTASEDCADRTRPEDLLWNAVADGQFSLAHHLRATLPAERFDTMHAPCANLLGALAWAGHVQSPQSEPALEHERFMSQVDVESLSPPAATLAFAATLRPALLSPLGSAGGILRDLSFSAGCEPLWKMGQAFANCIDQLPNNVLDANALRAKLQEGQAEDRLNAARQDVLHHLEDAKNRQPKPTLQAAIWRQWLKKGLLRKAREAMNAKTSENACKEVEDILAIYKDRDAFLDLVQADCRRADKTAHRPKVQHTAEQLRKSFSPVAKALDTWLDQAKDLSAEGESHLQKKLKDLRDKWLELEGEALACCDTADGDKAVRAAKKAAKTAISQISALLAGNASPTDAPVHRTVMDRDLLLIPSMLPNPAGQCGIDAKVLNALLEGEVLYKSMADAFDRRLEANDLAGAKLCAQCLHDEQHPDAQAQQEKLDAAWREAQDKTKLRQASLRTEVECAYIKGWLDAEHRSDLADALYTSEAALPTLIAECDRVDAELNAARERTVAEIKREIDEHRNSLSQQSHKAITAALEDANLTATREIVDKLAAGQDIPGNGRQLQALNNFHATLRQAAAEPRPDSALTTAWCALSEASNPGQAEVEALFRALGFTSVRAQIQTTHAPRNFNVHTEPLMDREFCPLHEYGSSAKGLYRTVLGRPNDEVNSLRQALASREERCLLLHFAPLSEKHRRDLREWIHKQHKQHLILDDILANHLSHVSRENRLKAFFDCALPYACISPFMTTSGETPKELFFGRNNELASILDPTGSCFVYGGRQVGKTALLRTAEHLFAQGDGARIAQWIDLKAHDIGYAKEADAVWRTIGRKLEEAGLFGADAKPIAVSRPDAWRDKVREGIRAWTSKKEGRVLLLLDEADAFLSADAENDFAASAALKGIMDDTSRRFKVVFSGLHDVLRTTKRANHPLAHLGNPICVGPLLDNGEWKAARQLLLNPLNAIGCEVDGEPPLAQIFAATNYYPGLIQFFGDMLVNHWRNQETPTFPYRITADAVSKMLAKDEAITHLRERFMLTLQLDPRYEVLAYVMGINLEKSPAKHAEGLTLSHLLAEVKRECAECFSTMGSDEFQTLIEEMVGLGVFRPAKKTSSERWYSFRNMNLTQLLGGESIMVDKLAEGNWRMPRAFDPTTHRAKLKGGKQRAPLTFAQEEFLHQGRQVSIMVGCEAGGLNQVVEFMTRTKSNDARARLLNSVGSEKELADALSKIRGGDSGATMLRLVPESTPWTLQWLHEAREKLHGMDKIGKRLHVTFMAGPDKLTRLMADGDLKHAVTSERSLLKVSPWARRCLWGWCDDLDLSSDETQINKLLEATGGWPMALQAFKQLQGKAWDGRLDDLANWRDSHLDDILNAMGITDDAMRKTLALCAQEADGSSANDVAEYVSSELEERDLKIGSETVLQKLQWAHHLSLVEAPFSDEEPLKFNPLTEKTLLKWESDLSDGGD